MYIPNLSASGRMWHNAIFMTSKHGLNLGFISLRTVAIPRLKSLVWPIYPLLDGELEKYFSNGY